MPVLVATWWAAVLGGLTWALWGWSLPSDGRELPELLGFGDGYLTNVAFHGALALVFVITLPAVTRRAALLEARFAVRLLGGRRAAAVPPRWARGGSRSFPLGHRHDERVLTVSTGLPKISG